MAKKLLNDVNLDGVFNDTNQYVLGFTVFDVYNLRAGSKLRRAGPKGVAMWKENLRENGFSNTFFIRVYIEPGSCENYDEIVALCEKQIREEKKANRAIPSCGLFIDGRLGDNTIGYIVDGQHRVLALVLLCDEALKIFSCTKDDDRVKHYRYVTAIVYRKEIVENLTLLSKASNDQVSVSVPEDAHEKLTFIVALSKEYNLVAKQQQFKTSAIGLARFYLGRCGVKVATNKNKRKKKGSSSNTVVKYVGEGYHAQVCMVALAVAGTTLDHIQTMLQDAESGSTRQDEVTPCKDEWNIWCFGNRAKIEKRFRMFFDLCKDFRILR